MANIPKTYQWRDLTFVLAAAVAGGGTVALLGCVISGDDWQERGRLAVITLSMALAAALAVFTLREKVSADPNTVRIAILLALLFLTPAVLLIPATFEVETSPVWGLFGAIAGYLLRSLGAPVEPKGAGQDDA